MLKMEVGVCVGGKVSVLYSSKLFLPYCFFTLKEIINDSSLEYHQDISRHLLAQSPEP